MENSAPKHAQPLLITALAGGFLLICMAAFLGFIVQGPEMFLAMMENGLSGCF